MFIVGNFLIAAGIILRWAVNIYMWMIIIRALISWVNPDPYNPIVLFLRKSTDPVLEPLRRKIPSFGGIDFTPVIAIFILVFVNRFLVDSIIELGLRLR